MLPGVSGTLLAPTFVDRLIGDGLLGQTSESGDLRTLHRWWRRVERSLGPASSVRAIADAAAIPFFEARNYRLVQLEPHANGFVGSLTLNGTTRVALRVTPWGSDLGQAWRDTVRTGRLVGARWGIVFNGSSLRILDAQRCWSRRTIDFDIALVMRSERSLAALNGLVEAAGREDASQSLGALVARSEQHGVAVCSSLGAGVLDALATIFVEFERGGGRRHRSESFEQSVTIVYRLLFLLFAEARALVPTWHHTYRESYTIESLCRRAITQPHRRGFWKSVQAISRLAHHGCRAGDLVVTPFNGRLFSPRQTPLAERARVSDEAVKKAIVALAMTKGRRAREKIAYADLGVEQLGSVYERVLEYEPARGRQTPALARTSHDRKATGTFYTPRSITDFLVRRALHPVVHERSADAILNVRVLDPAMGSGAFLVAACRYLADALERAMIDEGTLSPDCSKHERMEIRRVIVRRCLYGVDLNPMATQLARLSLWLASLSGDRPLTFLDHHLTVGNSLSGAGLADLVRAPLTRRARREDAPATLPLFEIDPSAVLSRHVLPERFRLARESDDTPGAVQAKERLLAQLTAAGAPLARWKEAADLWCAAWFWNEASATAETSPVLTAGVYHDILATLTGRKGALSAEQRTAVVERARVIAHAQRFFHWELEFPEVFFTADGRRDPSGGFDVVLGNPPWDMLRADVGEKTARGRAREAQRAQLRFFRDSRIYRYQGGGHANRYQLFVERALQLARPGGRLALIVPAGLMSDHGSAALRRALLDGLTIERVLGFDNRAAVFPIHRDVRFLLLTATKEARTERVSCTFGLSRAQWLEQLPDSASDDPPEARRISLPRSVLTTWDAEHLSIPWLASPTDYEILTQVARAIAPLGDPAGWDVRFGRELNATDDRVHFVHYHDGASLLPIVEGKHLEPFRALTGTCTLGIPASRAATLVDPVRTFRRARLAYRDVASATNRLTLIAARLPAGTLSTHTVFCSKDSLGADAQHCLLALLNSLVANYLVRLRVTTHVTTATMAGLPIPRPATASPAFRELVSLARHLERTGIGNGDARYVRLNALAARLFGLTREQYEHVVSTFPLLESGLRHRAVAAYEMKN